ncbi:MAG: hypothetical protein IJZ06_06440 [Bacteroidales bacterium]|nr:hypothetical protein [Bacteroidales bacterium]
MATITFEYDAKSEVARKAIDLLVSSGIFKTMSEDVSLSDDTLEAMRELEEGGGQLFEDYEDYEKNILK